MLKNGTIISIQNIAFRNNEPVLIGYSYKKMKNWFESPCKSSQLNIHIVDEATVLSTFPLQDVDSKCVKVFDGRNLVIFPLIHCNV